MIPSDDAESPKRETLLRKKLNVPVSAPNNIIWAYPDGRLTIGITPTINNGSFVNFLPGIK
jgi:hypothetical protein